MFRFGHSLYSNAYGGGAQVVDNDFVIQVKTDNAGTSASNQFTLPVSSGGGTPLTIEIKDWGDGVSETLNTANSYTHTYPAPGEYDITLNVIDYGSKRGFSLVFNAGGDLLKLLEIKNWGTVKWKGVYQMLRGCTNLKITATDSMVLSDLVFNNSLQRFLAFNNTNWSTKMINAESIGSWQECYWGSTSHNQVFNQPLRTAGVTLNSLYK